jgi:hypothetical protein
VSILGVTFTVADVTMSIVLNLVEVTGIIHMIGVTLLHIIHLIAKVLLLPPTVPRFSHGHIQYIVHTGIQRPLQRV